jgi:RNA-directed DNA polymerase
MGAGEARPHPAAGVQGTEVTHASECLETTNQLMEEVCEPGNLQSALKQVRRNKGAPGVDGMTVDHLPKHLEEHWADIQIRLLAGTYKPQPVRRVELPKPDGGVRKLGIPTVLDRLIQQAILQVLQPRWDPTFSEQSFGFRPNRSAHQAVARAQEYIADEHDFVVDIDLERFFDRVNHDMLMGRVAKRVQDKRLLRLLRAFLNAGVLEDGLIGPTDEGTPQGGPLSPLLSNLVLDDLDRELERRGHLFVRYADDCNVYVRSEAAGHRVMASLTRFITRKLKLKVNEAKSAVGRPWERKFLGFSFTNDEAPRRTIAPKALQRFKERVREATRRVRGASLRRIVADLAPYLRGWAAYFGFCETRWILRDLDGWLRRRLRSLVWNQWGHGRRRFRALRRLGISEAQAARTAGGQLGPWPSSRLPTVQAALSNVYFAGLGLPSLVGSPAL